MSICLVYDDRADVSADIHALLGVRKFSQVLYRKRTLLEHVRTIVRSAGIPEFIHLQHSDDFAEFAQRLHRSTNSSASGHSRRFLYYPSSIIPRDIDAARLFLQKLRFARRDIAIPVGTDEDANVLLWSGEPALRDLLEPLAELDLPRIRRLTGRAGDGFATVGNAANLTDISRYDTFVEFLSTNFDARHFNAIEHDSFSVRKRSTDVAKARREFTFLSLVDGPVSAFFLRPFDYAESEHDGQATASYRLERLNVPDMAIQWIHGAVPLPEFNAFLDRIETYFRVRPSKEAGAAVVASAAQEMYAGKITERMARLKELPECDAIEQMLSRTSRPTSLNLLSQRWQRLAQRISPLDVSTDLAFTHGDPCFSNILYDRRIQQLKLIDPRGADNADDLFGHPYYDVAKFSHSVLGGYDFINHNLFDLELDGRLGLSLSLATPDLNEHQKAFARRMTELGFDYRVMRLYEASLFLSMLPLHIDVPKKTVAFALTAARIMDELDSMD